MTLDASVTITALVSGVTSFKISSASISPSVKERTEYRIVFGNRRYYPVAIFQNSAKSYVQRFGAVFGKDSALIAVSAEKYA